jgi:hypothetical protein
MSNNNPDKNFEIFEKEKPHLTKDVKRERLRVQFPAPRPKF